MELRKALREWIVVTKYKLLNTKEEFIYYLIFGFLASFVNIFTYWLLANTLEFSTVTSNTMAIILSVVFAYITNKEFVFKSKRATNIEGIKECIQFFLGRGFTGLIDTTLLYIGVDILNINDLLMKFVSSIIVVVLNYIISKIFIFKTINTQST